MGDLIERREGIKEGREGRRREEDQTRWHLPVILIVRRQARIFWIVQGLGYK